MLVEQFFVHAFRSKMLYPNPFQMNTDPKHWLKAMLLELACFSLLIFTYASEHSSLIFNMITVLVLSTYILYCTPFQSDAI